MVLSSMQLQKVCDPVIPPASMPCTTFCIVCFYQRSTKSHINSKKHVIKEKIQTFTIV